MYFSARTGLVSAHTRRDVDLWIRSGLSYRSISTIPLSSGRVRRSPHRSWMIFSSAGDSILSPRGRELSCFAASTPGWGLRLHLCTIQRPRGACFWVAESRIISLLRWSSPSRHLSAWAVQCCRAGRLFGMFQARATDVASSVIGAWAAQLTTR